MERNLIAGQLYKHFKGNLYQIIGVAAHTELEEELVIYQALYGDYKIYARPLDMFLSTVKGGRQRFALVDRTDLVSATETVSVTEIASQEKTSNAEELEEVNPDILCFLEGEGSNEKIEILKSMKRRLTDKILEDMAVSMDFVLTEGSVDEKYGAILNCLEMKARFETNRFR